MSLHSEASALSLELLSPPDLVETFGFLDEDPVVNVYLLALTALISFLMPLRFVSLNTVFMTALEHIGHGRAGWQRGAHMAGMFLLGPVLAAGVIQLVGHAGSYWLIAGMFFTTALLAAPVLNHQPHTPPSTGHETRTTHAAQVPCFIECLHPAADPRSHFVPDLGDAPWFRFSAGGNCRPGWSTTDSGID